MSSVTRRQARSGWVVPGVLALAVGCASGRGPAGGIHVAASGLLEPDGSRGRPFRDLGEALRAARPGDVVRVHRGVYRGGILVQNAGVRGRPIVVRSEDGPGAAQIVGGDETLHLGAGAAWLVFEGLDLHGSRDNVLHIDGGAHHLLLRDLHVHDAGTDGDCVKINQASHIVIERLHGHAPGRRVDDRDNPSQEVVDAVDVEALVVRDSYLHDGGSILLYAKGGSRHVLFERNVLAGQRAGASDPCLGVGGWTSPEYLRGAPYEVSDIVVRNNVVAHCHAGGIAVYDATRAWIVQNTLLDVGADAIRFMSGNAARSESRGVHLVGNLVASTRGRLARAIVRQSHAAMAIDIHHNAYWNAGRTLEATGLWDPRREPGAVFEDPLLAEPATHEPTTREGWLDLARPGRTSPLLQRAVLLAGTPGAVDDDVTATPRGRAASSDIGAVQRSPAAPVGGGPAPDPDAIRAGNGDETWPGALRNERERLDSNRRWRGPGGWVMGGAVTTLVLALVWRTYRGRGSRHVLDPAYAPRPETPVPLPRK